MLNGEQRFRVRVPNAPGLHCTTQCLTQEYLNLVDWKGLELPSTERRCKASVKKFERSPTVLAEWIELKKHLKLHLYLYIVEHNVFFKASATNSHVPSFLSSGVFEIMMSADSVNAFTLRSRRGRKASAISKLVARLCRNPGLQFTTAFGANYSQPSVGTPWNPKMTVLGSGTSRQRLARLLMKSGQFVKSSCT